VSERRRRLDPGAALLAHVGELTCHDEWLPQIAAAAPIGLFVAWTDGRFAYVNDRWCELAGLDPEQALGLGWQVAVHPDDVDRVAASLAVDPAAEGETTCEYRLLHPGTSVRYVECRTVPFCDGDRTVGWLGTCIDVTRRRHAYDAALGEGEQFTLAFEHAPIATGLLNADGDWLHVNSAFCELVGYPEAELLTLNLADLLIPGDGALSVDETGHSRGECRYRRADGIALWVSVSSRVVRGHDGETLFTIVQAEDIGDRKQTERELRQLADHDALTGLLNRRGFMDGLHRELRRMDRRGEYGALLVLDLDNFKLVNDTAGHMAGDQVLRTTAQVLRRRLRATDVVGRLGGDEFAALVLNVTAHQAREIAKETTDSLRALTVTAGDQSISVDASIGVVAIDGMRTETEDELLAAADRAMYRAKSQRREP
jgi:diguanylate cyclase (GGDEF)-like protein/PAS domain S-box-containing protein